MDLDKLEPAVVDYGLDYEKENLLKIRDCEIYNLHHEAFLIQEKFKDCIPSHQHVELNSEEDLMVRR